MMRQGIISVFLWIILIEASRTDSSAQSNPPASFKEVYGLIRDHLAGITEQELDRSAVQGLVSALAPKVLLVTNGSSGAGSSETNLVTQTSFFDGDMGYVRIGQVGEGLADAVQKACQQLGSTNKLKGIALDLRYAVGVDYAAAASTADLFIKKERPLLNWGNGMVISKEKSDAINLPVAVLVNRQTSGAAEALAAILRESGTGLILGAKTSGQAMVAQDFPLSNGQKLRIQSAPVQLGDGTTISGQGVSPDIAVEVAPEDEAQYFADAFKSLNGYVGAYSTNSVGGTNRIVRRQRVNEAELVRERKEGASIDSDSSSARESEPEKPVVRDPVLARALDLLKGLSVVRQSRA
jgi:hypothetical protein